MMSLVRSRRSFMCLALTLLSMPIHPTRIGGTGTGMVDAADSNLDPECPTEPEDFAFLGIPGVQRNCIDVGGEGVSDGYNGKAHQRCFYTYVPSCAGEDAPLVMDMHGYASCPFYSASYTGWAQKAAEECLVLVWPMGNTDPEFSAGTCWSLPGGLVDPGNGFPYPGCCCGDETESTRTTTDDMSFLRNVVALTVEKIPIATSNSVTIDTKRIYMAGHSNGCIASIGMGMMHSDLVAAVGCHSGTTFQNFPTGADSEQKLGYTYPYIPTPMIMVHGKNDDDIVYPLATMAKTLVSQANGCTIDTDVRNEDPILNNYNEIMSTGCTNGANVTLIAIDDVGHFPYPGCKGTCYQDGVGEIDTLIDTTALAWDFMKTHSSAVAPELKYCDKAKGDCDGNPSVDSDESSAPTSAPSTDNGDESSAPTSAPSTEIGDETSAPSSAPTDEKSSAPNASFAFMTLGSLALMHIANEWFAVW